MFQCFILHVTTIGNVLKMFYAKTFAKMLQKHFSRIKHGLDSGYTCKIKHLQKCFTAVDFPRL